MYILGTIKHDGLISASKKFNILSYDIPHGIQGSHQAMYTHWMSYPDEDYQKWCLQIS